MKNNVRTLIIVAISFVALLIIALVAYNALRETAEPMSFIPQMIESSTEVETEAAPQQSQEPKMPDIPFYSLDGTETSFEQIREGRAVVINYWASWCPPCKEELPHFQKAYDTYGDQISFIFLNALDGQRETIQTVTKFIKDFGFTGPVYTDEGLFAYIFQTNSLPTTVFI
ncbi:MAG: redoxin domain-containing protein, partial [Spirochaetia bacterium]|nr:redoxin domain-containing protein [Spirochaetia bacterium]